MSDASTSDRAPVSATLPFYSLGVSHHTAPVEILELANVQDAERDAILTAARRDQSLERLVLVSTCNRVELYAHLPACTPAAARERLATVLTRGQPAVAERLAPHLHFTAGAETVRHLCRVAVGLESLVVGERQILTQIAGAARAASAAHATSPLLRRAFKAAVRAGERAHGHAWSAGGPTSISAVAADVTVDVSSHGQAAHVVVVGAGTMARLAVKALRARGVTHVTIANRTFAHAEALAQRYHARDHHTDGLVVRAVALDAVESAAADADAIVVATGAPGILIGAGVLARVQAARAARPLTVVDIGVPRNVDPAAHDIAGLTLIDLDAIRAHIDRAVAGRREMTAEAEVIADEAITEFLANAAAADDEAKPRYATDAAALAYHSTASPS